MNLIPRTLWKTGISTILSIALVNSGFATDSVSVNRITASTHQNGYPAASCNYLHFNTGVDGRKNLYTDDNYRLYFGNITCPNGGFVTVNFVGYNKPTDGYYINQWILLPYFFSSNGSSVPSTLSSFPFSISQSFVCGDNPTSTTPPGGYYQSFYICIRTQGDASHPDYNCDHNIEIYLNWTLYCYS